MGAPADTPTEAVAVPGQQRGDSPIKRMAIELRPAITENRGKKWKDR